MPTAKRTIVLETRPAGEDHQVVSVQGAQKSYRKQPCSDCPWRVDAVGEFPAEAFRHSARTAYDLSEHVFACHESGVEKPKGWRSRARRSRHGASLRSLQWGPDGTASGALPLLDLPALVVLTD